MAEYPDASRSAPIRRPGLRISASATARSMPAAATTGAEASGRRLEFNLFGDIHGFVHPNFQVSDRALQFGMSS